MLGHMLFDYFSSIPTLLVYKTTRTELDVNWDGDKIEKTLSLYQPDIVINCIGIINKYAGDDPYSTFKINTSFPHFLNYLSKKQGWRLIHISSDCVFDNDLYGNSKLYGEIKGNQNLTIRTSIIGPELNTKNGLLEWFLSQDKEVKGYTNVYWDGVTTLHLAKFIETIMNNKSIRNVINYRCRLSLNKYDLLNLIAKIYNKNIKIIPDDSLTIDRRDPISDYWCNISYEKQLEELRRWSSKK